MHQLEINECPASGDKFDMRIGGLNRMIHCSDVDYKLLPHTFLMVMPVVVVAVTVPAASA